MKSIKLGLVTRLYKSREEQSSPGVPSTDSSPSVPQPPTATPPSSVPPTDASEPSNDTCDHRERDETEISVPATQSVDDPRTSPNLGTKEGGKSDEKGDSIRSPPPTEASEDPPGVVGKNMEIRRMSATDEGDKVLRSAWDSPEKVG